MRGKGRAPYILSAGTIMPQYVSISFYNADLLHILSLFFILVVLIYLLIQDKHGNPPGIIRDEEVDPIPPLLKSMIKRMVAWRVLPPTCIPNSCIINIYDKDDCIPPYIDPS